MQDVVKLPPRQSGAGDLFQLLRDGRPRTRADLAAATGQGRSTISARVEALMSAGLIAPAGEASSTGGRPPATFAFEPSARVVLAVDLGATHVRLAVTDLASHVLVEGEAALAIADGPDVVLPWVAEHGRKLVAEAGRALDEHRSAWPDVDDMLFVKVATGIGSGIISDGELRRGAQGAAGDIGHIAVPGAEDVPCRCGNLGCLEAVASGRALAEQLSRDGAEARGGADVV